MMKIGILGGTFDPIHRGHLSLAEAAKKECQLDKVLFIPALIPPHKTARRDLTPAPYRYRMVELATESRADFEVSDIEFSRPEVSYTVETLRALEKDYPHDQFYLIIGEDSLAELASWKDYKEILDRVKLIVAKRPGASKSTLGYDVTWLNMPEDKVSSSQIRDLIRDKKFEDDSMLPKPVLDYIDQMKLYLED